MLIDDIAQSLQKLRSSKPLVLSLTNHVTMDFMANCLLSLGAAPIMSEDVNELDELVQIVQVLNLNIGTLNNDFLQRAISGAQFAQAASKPIILDPVGAGATAIRTQAAQALLPYAAIVRGNASEIMALAELGNKTLGVEAAHQVDDAAQSARDLARLHHCTIVVSGERDLITDGHRLDHLAFGSALMPCVTGMGCALTAVIAAFRAVIADSYQAARQGAAYYSLCGSLAAGKTNKPGSFRTAFIDELYAADLQAMRSICHAD